MGTRTQFHVREIGHPNNPFLGIAGLLMWRPHFLDACTHVNLMRHCTLNHAVINDATCSVDLIFNHGEEANQAHVDLPQTRAQSVTSV